MLDSFFCNRSLVTYNSKTPHPPLHLKKGGKTPVRTQFTISRARRRHIRRAAFLRDRKIYEWKAFHLLRLYVCILFVGRVPSATGFGRSPRDSSEREKKNDRSPEANSEAGRERERELARLRRLFCERTRVAVNLPCEETRSREKKRSCLK